jgi:hypothetical protein
MRRILAFGVLLSLGVTAAVADTTGSCSIRAGRTEEKMSFNWQRGDCATEHRCNDGGSDMLWSKWSGMEICSVKVRRRMRRMKAESGEMRCRHSPRGRDPWDLLIFSGCGICEAHDRDGLL